MSNVDGCVRQFVRQDFASARPKGEEPDAHFNCSSVAPVAGQCGGEPSIQAD